MQRQTFDVPAPRVVLPRLHDGVGPLGPPRPAAARPHGDPQHLVLLLLRRIEVPDEAAVDLHLAEVVLGRHVAAAVPALVAEAQKRDLVRVLTAVGRALLAERRRRRGRHVLEPLGPFLRRAGPEIDRQVGLAANLARRSP